MIQYWYNSFCFSESNSNKKAVTISFCVWDILEEYRVFVL